MTWGAAAFLAAAASAWVIASEHRDPGGAPLPTPRVERKWPLSPERAPELRGRALREAQVRLASPWRPAIDLDVIEEPFACRFLADVPSGTSPKFDCVLDNGEVVKVKYGRNPEIAGEVAATRLISALGFPADRMSIAPRVRCDGCPRHPFAAMRLLQLTGLLERFPAGGFDGGYSEFEWVAVERKLDAAAIELPDRKGWGWWELERVDPARGASAADLDALRLLAVFLAHWDNKDENQRLVCLDPPGDPDRPCARPVAMMQDLGATFGPRKVNLAQWRAMPVWEDAATCTLSMERLPWHGGTFAETQIGEAGRRQLAAQLAAIREDEIEELFRAARFPDYYSGTSDEKDLVEWSAAFQSRVEQIVGAGPCPAGSARR